MENRYTYLFLDMITIAGPLFLSFDKKVAFYKSWKYYALSMLQVSAFYIMWDVIFTETGIWKFNPEYLIGKNIINLPLEEYLFFLVVPYSCLFIYACLKAYFPKLRNKGGKLYYPLLGFTTIMSLINYNKIYTVVTFGVLSILLAYLIFKEKTIIKNYGGYMFISWAIALLPMAYVNGILTSKPVLIYNDLENCGIRVGTIPFEDFFYNMLYMVAMIAIYERLRKTEFN